MTIYRAQIGARCVYCRKYDLPCNETIHGNELFPYVPLIESTHFTADQAAAPRPFPITRLATPRPAADPARRARALSTVAIFVVMVCAALVMIGAYVLIVGTGNPCTGSCQPAQLTTPPASAPPLPDLPWQ